MPSIPCRATSSSPGAEAASDSPPLDESHFAMVRRAGVRRRKLTHAARIALTSSTLTLCIGVPVFLLAAIGRDWSGTLTGPGQAPADCWG